MANGVLVKEQISMTQPIFAVIDPTTDNQRALQRSLMIIRNFGAEGQGIHAFICAYSGADADDAEALERVEIARHTAWLDSILDQADTAGIEITKQVVWDRDWREAIAPAAQAADAAMIVKSTYRRSPARRRLMKTSDLRLLRTAHCPVLLLKRDAVPDGRRVLVAVNIAAEDPPHVALNERIIAYAHNIVATRGAELHAVNAYTDSDHFIHPPDLAKRIGIDRAQAHSVAGTPEKAIAEVADQIDAQLVIIGTVARKGLTGATLGNTVERVLDHVETDMLTIVHRA
jgi:universal stress protein E